MSNQTAKPSTFTLWSVFAVALVIVWFAFTLSSMQCGNDIDHARTAVSLSNSKQQSMATALYSADYNDYLPLGTAWLAGKNAQLCLPAPVGCFSTWGWAIQAYMKSSELFVDPMLRRKRRPGAELDRLSPFYSHYGYNYAYLSPFTTKDGFSQHVTAISRAQAADPENTILSASKWARDQHTSQGNMGHRSARRDDDGRSSRASGMPASSLCVPERLGQAWVFRSVGSRKGIAA